MDEFARDRVKELLTQAAALPADRRTAHIAEHAGDPAVAREALALLATLEHSAFMIAPTVGHAATGLDSPAGESAGDRIGPYKLLQKIGEGGFGAVFMAEQIEPVVRRVALKIIKLGMDTRQVIARFEAERQALAMMDHPNIAKVLDAGATDRGRPYFVMELVRGEPVTDYCDREQLSVAQRLELFGRVCNAVQHAHQKGIIHRDLKPSNVLVTVADGEPVPKVIDFGIAKATAGRLTDKTLFTELHQLIGTPEYMSPEQAELSGVDIDTRSDVYALGVLLYDLLVGSTPIEGRRLRSAPFAEIQRLIRVEEPPPPSQRLATLVASSERFRLQTPPEAAGALGSSVIEIARRRRSEPGLLTRALRGDLDWIVMKCLEKDRRRRYQTVGALGDDIRRYLEDQPVLATPPSARYKIGKFVRRHRAAVLAGGAIAATLVLGVVGTAAGLVWAVREQHQAEEQQAYAQNEADRADRAANEAQAINEFMREVLTSVEPESGGADVRLIDVLAGASAAAPHRFAGQPLQEASVHDLLGQVYSKLSLFAEGKTECAEALNLRQEFLGADDSASLVTEARCAGLATNMEQTQEAERILTGLLPRMERVLGPDDPETLDARRLVAIVHAQRGRLDEAERILIELRSNPGIADDEAMQIRLVQTLLSVNRRRSGADRVEQLAILREGELLASEWVERSTRYLGPDAIMTLWSQVKLADNICDQGQYQAAADTCRAVLNESIRRFGECHTIRLDAMFTLATALTRLGETDEPAELYLRAIECQRQKAPADNPVTMATLTDALAYLDRGGRAMEGEALSRELTQTLQGLGGGHGSMAFGAELYVARFVSMQDRLDEAEPLFQSLMAQEEDVPETHTRARLHLFYGSQLARRGLFEDAERQLNLAETLIGDIRSGTRVAHPDDVILGYIELYEAWGRPEEADEYRRLREEVTGVQVYAEGE